MSSYRALVLMLGAMFGALGCVGTRAFVPAEHVTGLSPRGGQLAAEYTIREQSRLVAEVKVWSAGASINSSEDDDDVTVVQVGFEIQNHTEGLVRLDTKRLFLTDVKLDDAAIAKLQLLRVTGNPELKPGEERELLALFRLPEDVLPRDIVAYRVAWTLTNGGTYNQKTPFVMAPTRHDDGWGPYYYYPSYYYFGYPSYYYYGAHPAYWRHGYRIYPGGRYRRYYPGYP